MSEHGFVMYNPSCAQCGCGHQAPPTFEISKPPCCCSLVENKMSLLGWLVIVLVIWYFFFAGDDLSCKINCWLDWIRPCKKPPEERFYKIRLPTSPHVLQMYHHMHE